MSDAQASQQELEQAKRAAYMRGYRHAKRLKPDPAQIPQNGSCDPSVSLDVLASLDFTNPANLSVLRKGLIRCIASGEILANAASQMLRFAEAELAAASKGKDSGMKDLLRSVMSSPPPPAE